MTLKLLGRNFINSKHFKKKLKDITEQRQETKSTYEKLHKLREKFEIKLEYELKKLPKQIKKKFLKERNNWKKCESDIDWLDNEISKNKKERLYLEEGLTYGTKATKAFVLRVREEKLKKLKPLHTELVEIRQLCSDWMDFNNEWEDNIERIEKIALEFVRIKKIGEIEITIKNIPRKIDLLSENDVALFLANQINQPRSIKPTTINVFLTPSQTKYYSKLDYKDVYENALEKYDNAIEEIFEDYNFYIYKNNLYCFDAEDMHTHEEQLLLIEQHYFKNEKKFAKLKKEIKLLKRLEKLEIHKSREPIPEEVRFAVWRRDDGKCVKCGSNKKLEFDHIIPFSKGGSNTERNIQLLCEKCNREKSDKI